MTNQPESNKPKSRKKLSKQKTVLMLLTLLAGIGGLLYSVLIEPDQLVVVNYPVRMRGWPQSLDGLKIVVLSDLHVGSLHIDSKKLQRIVDESNSQKPDLILLLGDYVASGKNWCAIKPARFTGELAHLKARLGVYAVLGNHDWWYNGVDVRQCLEAANVKVLEDSSVKLEPSGAAFWLVGLGDLWTRKPNVQRAMASVPPSAPVILMTHNPDVFPSLPQSVTLTLAGHTHGGQVSLPSVGPLITPSDYGARYAKGLVTEDGKTLFVSSGIGTSILPIRCNVPPEISVLTLSH